VSDDDITLGSLFAVSKDDAAKAILEAADDDLWGQLRLPERARQAVAGKIADRVNVLLDVSVAEVLGRAWSTLKEVREHADPVNYPSGKDSTVTLGHYTVESEHAPRIELRIDDEPRGQLKFPVILTLEFEAGTVVIRDGSIRAVRPGIGKVTGTVSCATITIKKLGPKVLTLPGELSLAKPIAIPRKQTGRPPGA
jgi:hypothetical protein